MDNLLSAPVIETLRADKGKEQGRSWQVLKLLLHLQLLALLRILENIVNFMEKIIQFSSKTVVLSVNDIDTDQIIPARYLTVTTKDGLGEGLFADWRFDESGEKVEEFPLNQDKSSGCSILVAGSNFGCGSSREHAPWALVDYGFKAILSTSFADIFKNNALKNGLLPLSVSEEFHRMLNENEGTEITISLEKMTIESSNGMTETFDLESFSRYCLMKGVDQLGFIMKHEDQINAFENKDNK